MKRYRYGGPEDWLLGPPDPLRHPSSMDPYDAYYRSYSPPTHCFVYEGDKLLAVVDITPWRGIARYSEEEHRKALEHHLQTELDKISTMMGLDAKVCVP